MEGSLLLAKVYQDPGITTRNLKHLREYMKSNFEGKVEVKRLTSS